MIVRIECFNTYGPPSWFHMYRGAEAAAPAGKKLLKLLKFSFVNQATCTYRSIVRRMRALKNVGMMGLKFYSHMYVTLHELTNIISND